MSAGEGEAGMGETTGPPAMPGTGLGAEPETTKFGDLSSYFQGLQTRLAVTIALAALTATLALAVRSFLPGNLQGATPLLVYAPVFLVVLMLLDAAAELAVPGELPRLVERRLASRALAKADSVDERLHKAFNKEIARRHDLLDRLSRMLALSVVALIAYSAMLTSSLLGGDVLPVYIEPPSQLSRMVGAPPPLCVAMGSSPAPAACGFTYLNAVGAALVAVFSLYLSLTPRRRLRRRRHRFDAAAATPPHTPR